MYWGLLALLVVVTVAMALWIPRDPEVRTNLKGSRTVKPTNWALFGIIVAAFLGLALLLIFNPDLGYFLKTGELAPAS
jgi:hypothetical protein